MRFLATAAALCFLLSQQASAEGRSSVEQVERKPTAQPAMQAPAAWPQGTDILTGAPQQLQAPTARPQGPETPTSAQQPLRARAAARQDYFPLTAAERTGINDRIAECLSIDPGARGEQDIVVELLVNMDADGTVRSVRPNGAIPTERRARLVYEAAQRAFVDPRCNPLPLPPGRREALRDMGFRISTRDLGLR